jgi:hypothetical protein
MKKLRMIVTSVIIIAVVSSAFAFKAKKMGNFCYSITFNGICIVSPFGLKAVPAGSPHSAKYYYVIDWDGASCNSASSCTAAAGFLPD